MKLRAHRLLAALILTLVTASGAFAQDSAPAKSAAADADESAFDTSPVVLDGHELFLVVGVATLPAPRRADLISRRIRDLARDRSFDPATLAVVGTGADMRIAAPGGNPVLRVITGDAEASRLDQGLLADLYLARIRDAIMSYRAARTPEALTAVAWKAGLATLAALIAFAVLRLLYRALHAWLERRFGGRDKGVSIRSFELMRAERIRQLVRGAVRTVGALSLFAVILVYLRITLGLIPWTRGATLHFDDWVLGPLRILGAGLVAKIPNLIFLAVLALVIRYLIRLVHLFFLAVGRGDVKIHDFEPEWAEPTYKIVRAAMIAFGLIVAYPYIPGSSSEAFKGVSLFAGVLLSLGSSSTISNVMAGYVMIYRRAFREGDLVKIGSQVGSVSRVRLQVTHLRTLKNEEVVIPNSTILAGDVINYSTLAKTQGLILHTTVGIGYETPWRQVEAMLLAAADRTEGLQKEPPPFVLHLALGDFAVTYEINAYCSEPAKMLSLYAALYRNILDLFNENGVQIMTPAYVRDPVEPKVVPPAKWHTPLAPRP